MYYTQTPILRTYSVVLYILIQLLENLIQFIQIIVFGQTVPIYKRCE